MFWVDCFNTQNLYISLRTPKKKHVVGGGGLHLQIFLVFVRWQDIDFFLWAEIHLQGDSVFQLLVFLTGVYRIVVLSRQRKNSCWLSNIGTQLKIWKEDKTKHFSAEAFLLTNLCIPKEKIGQ